jgi:hypothetical protein
MKNINVKTTSLELTKLNGKSTDGEVFADTLDLMETTLDIVPQGGFTPKDIRDRNRIQTVIDELRDKRKVTKDIDPVLSLEDHDYDVLKNIVSISRWASRDKVLQEFLDSFKE